MSARSADTTADTATTVADPAPPAPPGSPPRRREAPIPAPAPPGPALPGRRLRKPGSPWSGISWPEINWPALRWPSLRRGEHQPKAKGRSRRERRLARAAQLRRADRVVRRVDPWSVLKISAVFYVCLWIVVLTAGVLLWAVAASAGAIENVEDFIKELGGFEKFAFEPAEMLRACLVGGLVLTVAGSLANVFLAVVFNLISDLVGGVRLTVLEEERPRRSPR